jgi:hypothetical protein
VKLYVLMHHPEDDPTLMPNAIAVTDEYTIEDSGRGFWEEEMLEATAQSGPGTTREIVVVVADSDIEALFRPPVVHGHVKGERS